MALTPHEEREIHQIEEALIASDPGFVARMTGLLKPRRGLVVCGIWLLVGAALALLVSPNLDVSVLCVAASTFSAGWCLGRAGRLDVRSRPLRVVHAGWRAARRTVRFVLRRH